MMLGGSSGRKAASRLVGSVAARGGAWLCVWMYVRPLVDRSIAPSRHRIDRIGRRDAVCAAGGRLTIDSRLNPNLSQSQPTYPPASTAAPGQGAPAMTKVYGGLKDQDRIFTNLYGEKVSRAPWIHYF